MDEKSKGSWVSGLPARGTDARFESRVPEGDEHPGPEQGEVSADRGSVGDAGDIVFIVKQDGTILYLNRVLEGQPDGAAGTSLFIYTGSEQHDVVRESLDLVFSSGEPQGFECQGVEPFDPGAWYQCRVAPNAREGKVVSATIIARDVTNWKGAQEGLLEEREALKADFDRVSGELERLKSDLERGGGRQLELDRFRAIMDQAGEAIFITDPDTGRFVDANETACRWLGYKRDKLLTLSINDVDLEFPLESPNGVPEHVTDTRGSSRPKVFSDGCHRRRNGTSFPVEVAINRKLFGDKQFVLVIARDIKERRLTRQALRESEDKFRSLFELTRDAIYLSSRDGSVAAVNDAAIDLFGYTRAEFLELEARRLYECPDDIRTFQRGVDSAGSVRDMKVDFRTKSGEAFAGLLTATLRHDGEGNILGYQCIVHPVGQNGRAPQPKTAELPDEDRTSESGVRVRESGVLVVDSDKRVLVEVREVLERAGIPVLTARTSAAAVEVYRSESAGVGVVLLGEDDGDDDPAKTVGQMRAIDPDVTVVMLLEEGKEAPGAGGTVPDATDMVRKPIHPLALVQHVREAISERES